MDNPTALQVIIGLISAIVIAVISSIVTIKLSIHQFRTEKWWERKAEAYIKIIEALYHISTEATGMKVELTGKKFNDLISANKETLKRLNTVMSKSEAGFEEVSKTVNIGELFINKEASKELIGLAKKINEQIDSIKPLKSEADMEPTRKFWEEREEMVRTCIVPLIKIAKKDLGIE